MTSFPSPASPRRSSFFVGAIDQGTTSTRFILYDESRKAVASHQLEHKQICPRAGWVEHDPMEIIKNTRICMEQAMAKAQSKGLQVNGRVRSIGITNQRETTVTWSRSAGRPLHNAIVWMDIRTSAICKMLEQELEGGKDHFRAITGLPITSYFSALKLKWLLANVREVKSLADAGDALFGTIDSWIIWNLTRSLPVNDTSSPLSSPSKPKRTVFVVADATHNNSTSGGGEGEGRGGEGVHVTDCSNASRTMLMDLRKMTWDAGIAEALGIPMGMLPKIVSNAQVYGVVGKGWPLEGVPLGGCLGDQHAALLGQLCTKGAAKSTYGTGCFILLNTGESVVSSRHGLLTTMGFKLGPKATPQYALEGSIAIAGAAVQWLRDNLGIITKTSDVEALANSVANTGGVYFVPAFSGLFAPWWREDARGVCVGLTRYSTKAHIARAVLESICYQVRAVVDAMREDLGQSRSALSDKRKEEKKKEEKETEEEDKQEPSFMLRVDGGASQNNLLMQLQADLLGCSVLRPEDPETTALGAAIAAGISVGMWTEEQVFASGALHHHENIVQSKSKIGVNSSMSTNKSNKEVARSSVAVFRPQISDEQRQKRYVSWTRAVERSMNLADLH